MTEWPSSGLTRVPPLASAADFAHQVRSAVLGDAAATAAVRDLRPICDRGGFRLRVASLGTGSRGHESLLVPLPTGGFEVVVDPDPPGNSVVDPVTRARRLRFRFAHEVAHSFFYDRESRPARRMLAGSKDEEAFCDAFASALLVPPRACCEAPLSPDGVFGLQARYDASFEATAKALASCHADVTVVGLVERPRPKTTEGVALRICWTAGSRFLPAGARVPDLVPDGAERILRLRLGDARGAFRVQALRRPRGRLVVAVLTPADSTEMADSSKARQRST